MRFNLKIRLLAALKRLRRFHHSYTPKNPGMMMNFKFLRESKKELGRD
jgi:hypothetical protein